MKDKIITIIEICALCHKETSRRTTTEEDEEKYMLAEPIRVTPLCKDCKNL